MSMLASAARGIKNIWSHGDEDEDYAEDEGLDSDESQAPSKYSSTKYPSEKYGADKSASEKYAADKYAPGFGDGDGPSNRVKNLRSVPIPLRAREKNIYTLRPKNQDEAAIAADYLKSGSAVVMNLETLDRTVAMRIIDFMSGVCYGLEGQGHAMKLGEAIFLFTPAEFEISSDELDYGENRDFFFKDLESSVSSQPVDAQSAPAIPTQTQPSGEGANPSLPPSGASASTTPSGYVTADYSGPGAPDNPVSTSVSRASTLPASAVYGSGGKPHVLINKPEGENAPQNPSGGSYQSSERRSWER